MQTKQKIAVIEDDLAISEMYSHKLKQFGFDVATAFNGQDGLTLVKSFRPELILLDIMMPLVDGAEMLEHLRQHEWGAELRVIILTNLSKDEAPHGLRFLNVDRYIVKAHHTPLQVVEVVREVLHLPKLANHYK